MKYFISILLLILTSCSLDKPIADKKLSNTFKKNVDFKKMTFEEFNLYLKDYSDNTEYPNIDN